MKIYHKIDLKRVVITSWFGFGCLFQFFFDSFSQSSVVAAAEKHQTHFSSHDCIASIRWFQMPFFFLSCSFLLFISFDFAKKNVQWIKHWIQPVSIPWKHKRRIKSKAKLWTHTKQKQNCGMKWISIWL